MSDYLVTGSITPDATGSYSAAGDYGGYPYYSRDGDSAFYLAYITDRYYLLDAPPGETIGDSWIRNASGDSPLGDYAAYLGAATGTATVSAAPAVETGSGGFHLRGAMASTSITHAPSPGGGVGLAGSALVTCTYPTIEASGGLALAGSARSGYRYTETPTGGVALGGAATDALTFGPTADGGLALAGTVTVTLARTVEPSGGFSLQGSVTPNCVIYECSGGFALGGSSASSITHAPAPSGGVALGGTVEPSVFATHYLDLRGLYRTWNDPAYRIYRSPTAPPEEGDTPAATAASLPSTPALAWADGTWYVSVSYFNGCVDSGFYPIGPAGETYCLLSLAAGEAAGTPPRAPEGAALHQAAGGVVRVRATYFDSDATRRATEWAIAYTTDGTDPAEDTPTDTRAIAAGAGETDVLDGALPAQAHGTPVRVRVQTRRLDGATWVYSQGSAILATTADATGPSAPLAGAAHGGGC